MFAGTATILPFVKCPVHSWVFQDAQQFNRIAGLLKCKIRNQTSVAYPYCLSPKFNITRRGKQAFPQNQLWLCWLRFPVGYKLYPDNGHWTYFICSLLSQCSKMRAAAINLGSNQVWIGRHTPPERGRAISHSSVDAQGERVAEGVMCGRKFTCSTLPVSCHVSELQGDGLYVKQCGSLSGD